MATARETSDHDEIREWVESRGGRPAQVEGTGGMLRIDFGDQDERLEPIEWDRFFEIFDESGLGFLYDPQGHMNKFVQAGHDRSGIGKTEPEAATRSAASRGARGTRKKSSGSRKKSSGTRKKSASSSRKKSSGARKKSAGSTRKKSSGTRKKSASSSRKKSSGTRKKSASSSRKKSSGTRKKSSSKKSGGRKYGRKAGKKVERAMHEMKRGKLRSGSKGPKVKSRKQAIAIGLSEARREGDKVPARRKGGRKKKR